MLCLAVGLERVLFNIFKICLNVCIFMLFGNFNVQVLIRSCTRKFSPNCVWSMSKFFNGAYQVQFHLSSDEVGEMGWFASPFNANQGFRLQQCSCCTNGKPLMCIRTKWKASCKQPWVCTYIFPRSSRRFTSWSSRVSFSDLPELQLGLLELHLGLPNLCVAKWLTSTIWCHFQKMQNVCTPL